MKSPGETSPGILDRLRFYSFSCVCRIVIFSFYQRPWNTRKQKVKEQTLNTSLTSLVELEGAQRGVDAHGHWAHFKQRHSQSALVALWDFFVAFALSGHAWRVVAARLVLKKTTTQCWCGSTLQLIFRISKLRICCLQLFDIKINGVFLDMWWCHVTLTRDASIINKHFYFLLSPVHDWNCVFAAAESVSCWERCVQVTITEEALTDVVSVWICWVVVI